MKISRKTDYGLRALFTLVEDYGRDPISIREIARKNDIPKKFLEQIMLELKEEGWVSSVPGQKGGYRLARRPEDIRLGEIIRHFDGILAPLPCVSITYYSECSQESSCRFRRLFLDIRNFTVRLMDESTLASVMAQEPVSRSEVFQPDYIFGAGI